MWQFISYFGILIHYIIGIIALEIKDKLLLMCILIYCN
jgi:hypothetical protein